MMINNNNMMMINKQKNFYNIIVKIVILLKKMINYQYVIDVLLMPHILDVMKHSMEQIHLNMKIGSAPFVESHPVYGILKKDIDKVFIFKKYLFRFIIKIYKK